MEPLTIFCAYAPEDKLLYDELEKQLTNLQHDYQLKIWSDIDAGVDRVTEINRYYDLASIILLLISPDFMQSDYYKIIKERVIARQSTAHTQHIIPILLRPVDWEHSVISRLKALPDKGIFVTSWSHQDEALLNIAKGIRRIVEKLQSPTYPSRPATKQVIILPDPPKPMKQRAKGLHRIAAMVQSLTHTNMQEEAPIKNYIYISDTKMINMLEQQIGWKREDIAPFQRRHEALRTTLRQLEKTGKIQLMQSEKGIKEGNYITGTCPISWGTVKWDSTVVCFFFTTMQSTPSRILLMAGSAYHLLGNEQSSKELPLGISASSLPGIISALQFAAERNNVKWSRGIGSIPDYLFALAFVQSKFFHELRLNQLALSFPEQTLEFTALVHKTLSPPSAQDLRSFFQSNAINKNDKKEINLMLEHAPEILLCSPVCVSQG